jgi:hypothetical protein
MKAITTRHLTPHDWHSGFAPVDIELLQLTRQQQAGNHRIDCSTTQLAQGGVRGVGDITQACPGDLGDVAGIRCRDAGETGECIGRLTHEHQHQHQHLCTPPWSAKGFRRGHCQHRGRARSATSVAPSCPLASALGAARPRVYSPARGQAWSVDSSGMQPRRHRMRQKQRRQSALGWIQSGASVTIKTYVRRYGVDRHTAHEDLTAIGFPLPGSARHWAHRPPSTPRPRRRRTDADRPSTDWITMDGRRYFIAGYTSAGFPYGIHVDEMDYLDGLPEAEEEACDDMPWSVHPHHLDAPLGGPPTPAVALRDTAGEGDPF